MRKRKTGLLIGASLLLAGASVTTAITTTSCSKAEKSGLTFSNWKLDKDEHIFSKGEGNDSHILTVSVDVDGLTNEWDGCMLSTLTSGETPDEDNMWDPNKDMGTDGLQIMTETNDNNGTKKMQGIISVNVNDVNNQGKFTFDNVWSVKIKENEQSPNHSFHNEGSVTFDYGKQNFLITASNFGSLQPAQEQSDLYDVKDFSIQLETDLDAKNLFLCTTKPNAKDDMIDSPTTDGFNLWATGDGTQGMACTKTPDTYSGSIYVQSESSSINEFTIHNVWGAIASSFGEVSRWFYINDVFFVQSQP